MVPRDTQIEILTMLEVNERNMAAFYQECAERFAEHGAVWRQLTTEEETHAMMIGVIRSMIEDGSLDLGHRTSWAVMRALADEVREQLESARSSSLTLEAAVAFADDAEHLLAESDAFRVHEGDPPELENLLHHLANDSLRHARSIEELSSKRGGTSGGQGGR